VVGPSAGRTCLIKAAATDADVLLRDQRMDAAMHWVFRHPSNERKSIFADADGSVHPYFNLVRMQRQDEERGGSDQRRLYPTPGAG